MYLTQFSLTRLPFDLLPDSNFLYLGKNHESALTGLRYGIESGVGFTIITGDIGAGKTTLIRAILHDVSVLNEHNSEFVIGLISNTHQEFGSLLEWILLSFGLVYKDMSEMERYEKLTNFVIENYAKGLRTVIIIDEAQNLEVDALEKLRVISNLNADHHKILQIILSGQPEFRDTLRRPELRQFAQRVTVDYHLGPLPVEEVGSYIKHRMRVAGSEEEVFSDDAIKLVAKHSKGIPRLINILCNNALVYAYADSQYVVDADTIRSVVGDANETGLLSFS